MQLFQMMLLIEGINTNTVIEQNTTVIDDFIHFHLYVKETSTSYGIVLQIWLEIDRSCVV